MARTFYFTLGFLLYGLVCLWIRSQLRYRVTSRSFRISLFGLRLRRVPLEQIEKITTKKPRGWVANWSNTLRLAHRILVIRLKHPKRRDILFTPPNRYAFKTELEEAIQRSASGSGDSIREPNDPSTRIEN